MPSTCECDASICSSSVEPARGKPTIKIGSGAWHPFALSKLDCVKAVCCAFNAVSVRAISNFRVCFFNLLPLSLSRPYSSMDAPKHKHATIKKNKL